MIQARGDASVPRSASDRTLSVLRLLAEHPHGVELQELAREMGEPKSSIHRALESLHRAGFVEHGRDGHYWLGWRFLQLAFDYHEQLDEVACLEPAMRCLADHFGETVHYAVLEGSEVVYRSKVQPTVGTRLQMTSVVGGRNPAHCTGVGKALLAFALPDLDAVRQYAVQYGPLARRTDRTIVDPDTMHQELATVRMRGFAVDREESEEGVNCLAFPLFLASTARPGGAVSVSAVSQRLALSKLEASADDMRQILTDRLGDVVR